MVFPLVIIASSATTAATVRNVTLTAYVAVCMGRDIWDTGKMAWEGGKKAKAKWDERQATKAQQAPQPEHQAQSATA